MWHDWIGYELDLDLCGFGRISGKEDDVRLFLVSAALRCGYDAAGPEGDTRATVSWCF